MEYYTNHRWGDAALFLDMYVRRFLLTVDVVVWGNATGCDVFFSDLLELKFELYDYSRKCKLYYMK